MLSHAGSDTPIRVKDVVAALGAKLDGDGAIELRRLVHPRDAQSAHDLALAISGDAVGSLADTKAAAVIVADGAPPAAGRFKAVIAVEPSRGALAVLTALFDPSRKIVAGVHPTAVVAKDAVVDASASVGAFAVIGAGSRVGANAVIADHVSIGAEVTIGAYTRIHAGARVADRSQIGARGIIYQNAVIGSDGFSFAPELLGQMPYPAGIKVVKIHTLGRVVIGDDVEIGATTTIDSGTLGETRIGAGTKIDNHVHIAHNVTIGEGCLICGACGISGSVTIGDRVRIAGGVGIADHVRIGTEVLIAAGSGVGNNIPDGTFVSGYPAIRHDRNLEIVKMTMRQKTLYRGFDELVSRVNALEQSGKAK